MQYKHTDEFLSADVKPDQLNQQNRVFIFISRVTRLILLFIYATFPMWGSWVANYLGYRDVSSMDMVIAMAWLPISGAIIALSFMKFSWKQKLKGTIAFVIYNAIALGCLLLWASQIQMR